MNNKYFSIFKFLIGWPISILAFIFLGNLVISKFQEITPYLRTPTLLLLIPGILTFLIFFFLRAFTWQKLLDFHGHTNIRFRETCFLWGVAEIKRFVPGFVWSYLGKTESFSKKGVDKKKIANMLLTEISLIVVSGFIVSLISLPFITSKFIPMGSFLILFINLFVLFMALFFIYNKNLLEKANLPKPLNYVKFALPGFEPYQNLILLSVSSASVFVFSLATYLTIASIVYLPIDMSTPLIGFFALSFLISYLAIIAPMGLGVREGFITFGLSKLMSLELAGFSAIFTRIILVLSEVLFLFLVVVLKNVNGNLSLKFEGIIKKFWREIIMTLTIFLYIFYFTYVSFQRFENFFTGRFDLGNMAQVVWNTINGRLFLFTNPDGTNIISRLSYHADFLLVLLSPFYLLWESPKMLLLIQTLVLAMGGVLIYVIGKDILKDKTISLILSVSYLLNPSVQYSNLYDFHPVVLATTFLLGTFYFMYRRKYIWFLIFLFLSVISKEQIWIIASIFGLYLFFVSRKRLLGGIISTLSIFAFYFLISYVIPYFRQGQHFAIEYYSDFGDSPLIIIKNILLSPDLVLKSVFSKLSLNYLLKLFLPLGFTSLFSPLNFIFAAPDLAINLLSKNPQFKQIYYQYTSAITPFIFISSIYGLRFLSQKFKKISLNLLSWHVIIFTLLGAYLYSPLPFSKKPSVDVFTKQLSYRVEIEGALRKIPQNAKVAATNNLGSHLSQRDYIFTIPIGVGEADYIVLLLNDPFAQPSLAAQKELAKSLKNDPSYQLMYEKENFIVFKKIN